jgi:hypothetical protein
MEIDDLLDGPDRELRFAGKYLDSTELGISYAHLAPNFVATDGHTTASRRRPAW